MAEIRLYVTNTEKNVNRILDLMSFAFGEAELKPLRSGEALPWRLVHAA